MRCWAPWPRRRKNLVAKGAPGAAQSERRVALGRYAGQGFEIPFDLPAGPLARRGGTARFVRSGLSHGGNQALDLPVELLTFRVAVAAQVWQGRAPVRRWPIAGSRPPPGAT
jgi:N-methylhydantoinase A